MKLLPLSIFVTIVSAAALPVNKIFVDEATSPDYIPGVFHENERVCRNGHRYYDNPVECFPDRTCDTGTCYHGYCYIDEEDIPWDDGDKPSIIYNTDNDTYNRDVAKRDGFWSIGDDKILHEMIDEIHHRVKTNPSMVKRKAQSHEDMEEFKKYFPPGVEDLDCDGGLVCDEASHCIWSTRPGMAKRNEPSLCNIPGEHTPYGYFLDNLEKRNTNKDVNCHNDEQCSPGVCQDGICLLK